METTITFVLLQEPARHESPEYVSDTEHQESGPKGISSSSSEAAEGVRACSCKKLLGNAPIQTTGLTTRGKRMKR